MTVRIVSDNSNQFIDRLERAFVRTIDAYNLQLRNVFTEPRLWPPGFGKTYRKNGEVVEGSFRNIVDLQNALNSQSVSIDMAKWRASFSWDGKGITPMVTIHEGAVLQNGGVIPPRPFTRVAAKELNLTKTFVEAYRNEV